MRQLVRRDGVALRVAQHRATQPMPPHAAPGDGLRLIPLSGFHWGGALRGRNMPPAPRVRGDHVLILLKGGVLQIEFPRNRQLLVPGRVAFIPAGTAFALNPGADVQGCALLLAPGHGRDLPMPLPPGCRFGAPAIEDAALIEPAMQALGAAQPRTSAGQAATACQMALIAVALSRLDERAGVYGPRQSGILEARPLTERFLELAEAELSQNQTIAELAREVISLTGSKSKIVHLPLPADDPQQRQPDISLARNMLGGWEPKIQLRDGLLKTIAYFEEVLSRGGIRR